MCVARKPSGNRYFEDEWLADRAESDGENALVHYAFGSASGTLLRGGCLQPRRMYDRKTSNRLAFAGTPCAGRGNTGTGAGRLPACTDNGTSRGRDYFSVSECRRGGKCPVCRCGSGGADGSAGVRAGTGDWTAVPFPKWYGGIDPGNRDGCADHRRWIAAP